MTTDLLFDLARRRRKGNPVALTAVCSAHPEVLRAAIKFGRENQTPVLIEATCNQVNQNGGYTGMRPADFVNLVHDISRQEGTDPSQIILGGDHLGPNPWRGLPVEQAMKNAEEMVAEYAAAGFQKFHLDTSMGCLGEPEALDDLQTATRAVQLAKVIEKVASEKDGPKPAYVIGTEVPPPGGATHTLDDIHPTNPDAALQTVETHRANFTAAGLGDAFERVIALVIQPGVEFGDKTVIQYDAKRALPLKRVLMEQETFCFEAHSTDYQTEASLSALVADGNSILKVGPGLSFALRESLYRLDQLAAELVADYAAGTISNVMEKLMMADPANWESHYNGTQAEQKLLRHYSYSDRIRYYWTSEAACRAVANLYIALDGKDLPQTLVSQFFPHLWRRTMKDGVNARQLVYLSIRNVMLEYLNASRLTSARMGTNGRI